MFDELAFRLYGALPKEENCFLSPLSIGAALAALIPGARGGTAEELGRVLGVPANDSDLPERVGGLLDDLSSRQGKAWESDDESGEPREVERNRFRLHIANALFVKSGYEIEKAYRQVLGSHFGSDLVTLDFGRRDDAASEINRWVNRQTHGRIDHLLSPHTIHELTRLVLANAVYFLADWRHPFDPDDTRLAPFALLPGSARETVEVPMMRKTEHFAYMSDAGLRVRAAELLYEAMSLLVIVPDTGEFRQVATRFDAELMGRIVTGLRDHRLSLELPRFTMESDYGLVDPLKRLGLREAFDREKADFGGISDDSKGLALDGVFHRARIRVDEHGTEAAAATAASLAALSLETEEPTPFVVDRPFIICIRDPETEELLFLGHVTDPKGGDGRELDEPVSLAT